MEKIIIEKIKRLAEINMANSLIAIGDDLKKERKEIVDYLIQEKIVELDNKIKKGNFHFIGEDAKEYKKEYLEEYNNF